MHKWAVIFLGLICIGCSGKSYDGPPRYSLSGVVTLDGAPVTAGTISFLPDGHDGRVSGGQIVDGKYDIPSEYGPNAGAYLVKVNWLRPTGKKTIDSDTQQEVDVVEETIPDRYHRKTELRVTVSDQPGVQAFDFELVSK
jgi:hypothetical protein